MSYCAGVSNDGKRWVVFWAANKWEFFLCGPHARTQFTFDEVDAQKFDSYGHAYEAAIHLERIHHHVVYVREVNPGVS